MAMPVEDYLAQHRLYALVEEMILQVGRIQPTDPVEYMGKWLLNRSGAASTVSHAGIVSVTDSRFRSDGLDDLEELGQDRPRSVPEDKPPAGTWKKTQAGGGATSNRRSPASIVPSKQTSPDVSSEESIAAVKSRAQDQLDALEQQTFCDDSGDVFQSGMALADAVTQVLQRRQSQTDRLTSVGNAAARTAGGFKTKAVRWMRSHSAAEVIAVGQQPKREPAASASTSTAAQAEARRPASISEKRSDAAETTDDSSVRDMLRSQVLSAGMPGRKHDEKTRSSRHRRNSFGLSDSSDDDSDDEDRRDATMQVKRRAEPLVAVPETDLASLFGDDDGQPQRDGSVPSSAFDSSSDRRLQDQRQMSQQTHGRSAETSSSAPQGGDEVTDFLASASPAASLRRPLSQVLGSRSSAIAAAADDDDDDRDSDSDQSEQDDSWPASRALLRGGRSARAVSTVDDDDDAQSMASLI